VRSSEFEFAVSVRRCLSTMLLYTLDIINCDKGCEGKGAPPHDGSCGHPLSSSLGLVILELVRLVNDLFGDDLLDDICACLHRSTFISVPSMTYLRGL